jgi:hypothetical protein
MPLTDLTSAQLERAVELIKEKESIQVQLDRINRSLESLDCGEMRDETEKEGSVKVRGRGRRGALKKRVLAVLGSAGKDGMMVKDLAKTLGVKPARVSIWFYTTGKKTQGIRKVGKSRYALAMDGTSPAK